MKPVISGARMPGTVAAVLVIPTSAPAYFGPISRWLIPIPAEKHARKPRPKVIQSTASAGEATWINKKRDAAAPTNATVCHNLRTNVILVPFRIIPSAIHAEPFPKNIMAMYGNVAYRPISLSENPRACTKYVGSHVRKVYHVQLVQKW